MVRAETPTFSATTAVSQYKRDQMNSAATRSLLRDLFVSMLPFSSVSQSRWLLLARSVTNPWQVHSPRPLTVSRCTWSSAKKVLVQSSKRKVPKKRKSKTRADKKLATIELRVSKWLKKRQSASRSISNKDKRIQEPKLFTRVSHRTQEEAQVKIAMALRAAAVSLPKKKDLCPTHIHVTLQIALTL